MNTFGGRLRAARHNANLTQERLGERVGVSKGAISRWESDQDQPQFAVLQPLRCALRVSLDELVCGYMQGTAGGVADPYAKSDPPNTAEWALLVHLRREPPSKLGALLEFLGVQVEY